MGDILQTYERYPELTVYGGNAGSTKSFIPLGLDPPKDLNGLGCFLCSSLRSSLLDRPHSFLSIVDETQMANLVSSFSIASSPDLTMMVLAAQPVLRRH